MFEFRAHKARRSNAARRLVGRSIVAPNGILILILKTHLRKLVDDASGGGAPADDYYCFSLTRESEEEEEEKEEARWRKAIVFAHFHSSFGSSSSSYSHPDVESGRGF